MGPLRNVAGGVDISLFVAIGSAAVLYMAMLLFFPEPRYVFGEHGPRWVPARDVAEPEVVTDPKAAARRQIARNREQELSSPDAPPHERVER